MIRAAFSTTTVVQFSFVTVTADTADTADIVTDIVTATVNFTVNFEKFTK